MTDHQPYSVPKPPGRWQSVTLAVIVHAALVVFLWIGVRWQNETPVAVQAELWSADTREAAPQAPPQKEPEAEPDIKPEPALVPAPVPVPKAITRPLPPAVKPPPPPPPKPVETPVVKPDIALEQEKKRQVQERKERLEDERADRARAEKLRAEQERKEKLKLDEKRVARQKAEDDARLKAAAIDAAKKKAASAELARQKAEAAEVAKNKASAADAAQKKTAAADAAKKAAAEKQRKQDLADEQESAKQRGEEMRRIASGATGSGGSGTAPKSQGGRADSGYINRVGAKIKSNTIFNTPEGLDGNPAVEYEVSLLPDGSIRGVRKLKSSNVSGFDDAVQRAISKSAPYPPNETGIAPSSFTLIHRPKDQ